MNNKYPSGLLLETRAPIAGETIRFVGKKEALVGVLIPIRSCVILLEYIRDFRDEDISLLWDNKIIFCRGIDLEHHFKILA